MEKFRRNHQLQHTFVVFFSSFTMHMFSFTEQNGTKNEDSSSLSSWPLFWFNYTKSECVWMRLHNLVNQTSQLRFVRLNEHAWKIGPFINCQKHPTYRNDRQKKHEWTTSFSGRNFFCSCCCHVWALPCYSFETPQPLLSGKRLRKSDECRRTIFFCWRQTEVQNCLASRLRDVISKDENLVNKE